MVALIGCWVRDIRLSCGNRLDLLLLATKIIGQITSTKTTNFMKRLVYSRYLLFWSISLSLISQALNAQSVFRLQGSVKSTVGETLPGVSILVEGQSRGTVSDIDGLFSIEVNGSETLVFSAIGFVSKSVPVNNQSQLQIALAEDTQQLNEVVVIGYGSVEKSDLTGAVASLRTKDFNPGANASVDQLILGRSAGVQVSQTSSEPGGGLSIRIRGASSVNAGNEPLYVIDGFPIDNSPLLAGGGVAGTGTNLNPRNPLNSLNPSDVLSVEILKDASATAIYGSRGANGVILITTKKGNAGRTSVNYDTYVGSQSVAKKMDILSTEEYIAGINAISADRGLAPVFSTADIANIGAGTNWQDEIYRTAPVQNHNLSVNGGDDKTTFFTSFNYFDQEGVVKNSGIKRYIARVNLDRKIGERSNFGINLNTSLVQDNNNIDGLQTNEDAGPIYSSLLYDPTEPIFNADGSYRQSPNLTVNNPVSLIEGIASGNETNRTFGNVYFQYKITDDLSAKINIGSDRQSSRRDIYNSKLTFRGAPANGIASITTLERSNVLAEYTMNYSKKLSESSKLDLLGGVTYQRFESRLFAGIIRNFPSDALGTDNLSLGDTNNDDLSSGREENSLLSYLGRVNYQLYNKFLFTGTLRADGSSRFGTNNQFGYFPSVAFGWKLIEESFTPNFFDDLKLRTSWGQTGNQEINNYASLSTFVPSSNAIVNDQPVVGIRPSRIANPDLKWETTEQLNIGIDASILDGRLSGTIDYFIKDTKDLLLFLPLPRSTGFNSVLSNVGRIRNSGFEFLITSNNITNNDFSWSTTANLSAIKNKVVDLGTIGDIITGNVTNVGNTAIIREGFPVNSYFGYQITGIFQNADQVASSAQPNSRPGFPIFKDLNGDNAINPADQAIIGNPFPDFTFGVHNTLSYKNFHLDFFIQGQKGGDLLNINVIESMYPGNFRRNKLSEQVLDRWTVDNPTAKWPSGVEPSSYGGGKVSDLVLQDASYIRLKNVQLSYDLPRIRYFQSARIYLVGQNLITLSDYIGFDPEANSFGRSNERVDYSSYPLARTWLLGLNLGF
jgi:TonB-linked SusC/RagA family outer membrane protein